ncbi:MAG TPA: type IV secretion system DNA-binding domain-containing protein [Pyrinomonadaceae bacterium]|nr:type IV secretion system DNA-binding domain-containing protein [Pyrinomonadaceae bacterium]
MRKNNIFTEEGQTRFRNTLRQVRFFLLIMVFVAVGCGFAIHYFYVWPSLTPLQRIYLRQYLRSTVKSYLPRSQSRYTYLVITVSDPKTKRDLEIGARDEQVTPALDAEGRTKIKNKLPVFRLTADIKAKAFFWKRQVTPDANAYEWFRKAIYDDQSIIDLWRPAWLGASVIFVVGIVVLTTLYQVFQHRYVKGEQVRGTRKLTPRAYRKEHRKHTGFAVTVYPQVMNLLARLQDYFGFNLRSYKLTVPREEENEGLLLLGDPGTGKSQIMHQLLDVIANRDRFEAVVCYDPAGEFVEQHLNPQTDIILNPLDARSCYWSPVQEIENAGDEISAPERHFVAESFFPDYPHTNPTAQFFVKAARSIFARMLAFSPSPDRLVEMLTDESLIDFCVVGTEHAHLIDKAAKAQRAGVLATLSEVGAALKLLPTIDECQGGVFTFREWAQHRHRRIFITSTQSTREAMRRLHAAWFNLMLGQLLGAGAKRSCWVIIDEVHALKRLSALETALVQARKYKVKIVLGTQNKAQFEEHYDRAAATMLSSSHTKILLRCNEPTSARWVSEMIGEQELERPRVSTTASVQSYGRDSLNYAPDLDRSLVVSKEQIMALPNLHGYWKYGDAIVPFRIEPQDRPQRAHAFIRRQSRPVNQPELPKELPASPTGNGHDQERNTEIEVLIDDTCEIDRRF